MSKLLAIAIPVLPGKEEDLKKFVSDINGRWREDFVSSRKKLGVRERTFFQQSPNGQVVIVTLEGEDPAAAFKNFSEGNDEFTKWFVNHVKDVHGVDLTQPLPGPLPELKVDSEVSEFAVA